MYRISDSLDHGEYTHLNSGTAPSAPSHLSPNAYMWPSLPAKPDLDYISAQTLLAGNGDPTTKSGLAIHTFSITTSMPATTAFSSLDGDLLIIPQAGALDIRTELGSLLVRAPEICVVPRNLRHNVCLPTTDPCRGYICELFQSHFQLPSLGVIGSTGLANIRDFQIPVASFDGNISPTTNTAVPSSPREQHTVVVRQNRRLWSCTQDHTPFDVVAWHGTCCPFKYDLARFCSLGNAVFDEHDPSLFTVLTVPTGAPEGGSVCDFAIIPPRWQVAENTMWLPYWHRNTCSEFYGPIVNSQNPANPLSKGREFKPFAAGLNSSMVVHGEFSPRAQAYDVTDLIAGAEEGTYRSMQNADTKPKKLMNDGITLFLLETEMPLMLSGFGKQSAMIKVVQKNKKESSKL